jgi:hypothetical protein
MSYHIFYGFVWPNFFGKQILINSLHIPSQNNLDLGLAKLGIGMVIYKGQGKRGGEFSKP